MLAVGGLNFLLNFFVNVTNPCFGHGHEINGHVPAHVDYIHFDRATYSHMTRTSSVVTFCLNVAVYTNLIQWIWAKVLISPMCLCTYIFFRFT